MSHVRRLQNLLKKKKMSPDLRRAIKATITALKKKDYELAYELSSVKSLIATKIEGRKLPRRYHFYEPEAQAKRRGNVYSVMDTIHHELAYKVQKYPSGMMVVSTGGIFQKGKPKVKHPIITMMNRERAAIRRRIRKTSPLY